MLARQPLARLDDHVADRPALIVEDEVLDLANGTILGNDLVTDDFVAAAQMRID